MVSNLKKQRLASKYLSYAQGNETRDPRDPLDFLSLSNPCHQTRKESDEGLTVRINTFI